MTESGATKTGSDTGVSRLPHFAWSHFVRLAMSSDEQPASTAATATDHTIRDILGDRLIRSTE